MSAGRLTATRIEEDVSTSGNIRNFGGTAREIRVNPERTAKEQDRTLRYPPELLLLVLEICVSFIFGWLYFLKIVILIFLQ